MAEPSDNSLPTWAVIALPFVFFLIFPLFWCVVCLIISRVGGWQHLARRYGTDEPPGGTRLSSQSGKVNIMGYNNCLTVHVSDEGIHMAVMILFRPGHQPLMIPWRDIHNMRQESFLWMKLTSLDVGEPKIATIKVGADAHRLALQLLGGNEER